MQVCVRVQGHCKDVHIHLGFMKQNLLIYGATYKYFSPRISASLKLNHKIDQSVVYDCVSIANAQLSQKFCFFFLCFSTMHSKTNFINVSSKQMVSSVATLKLENFCSGIS